MAQTLGLIQLTYAGNKIDIEKGGKVKLGGLVQKGVVTGQQVDYANEFEMSEIECMTRVRKGDSVLNLVPAGQNELQVLCDTGQTFSWPDAFCTNRPEFTAGEGGKRSLKFAAGSPTELLN